MQLTPICSTTRTKYQELRAYRKLISHFRALLHGLHVFFRVQLNLDNRGALHVFFRALSGILTRHSTRLVEAVGLDFPGVCADEDL